MALDTVAVAESLGRQIAASIQPVKDLRGEVETLAGALPLIAIGLADCIEDFCAELTECAQKFCDSVKSMTQGGGSGGRDLLSDAGTITTLVGFIVAGAAELFGLALISATVGWIIAIAAIIAGIVAIFVLHWDQLGGIAIGIGQVLLAILFGIALVAAFVAALPLQFIAGLFVAFGLLIGALLALFSLLGSGLGEAAMAIVGGIFQAAWGIVTAIWDRFGWWALLLVPFLSPLLAILTPIFLILAAIWGLGWLLNWAADHLWEKLSDIWDAVTDIPGQIADAIGGLASGIGDVFGSLLSFQGGGVVPGSRGRGGLVLAHAGEGVFTAEQMAAIGAGVGTGPGGVAVVIDGAGLDRRLLEWLRHAVRVEGGGNVQTALGQ